MITDKDSITKLQFRSHLPRFYKEHTYLFAVFEPHEQNLSATDTCNILAKEYMNLVLAERSNDIKSLVYLRFRELESEDNDFKNVELAFKLENGKFLCGKVKIFKNTFCYFEDKSLWMDLPSLDLSNFAT
ncbi:MAG: hypothetical protein QY314_01400 [Candidatus Dojkabacteria bacterium]|nr:MAG: hypothetical protein QY314_01400 [Candidatus Dojkabacteria bacterium]